MEEVAPAPASPTRPRVFMSYANEDRSVAKRLQEALNQVNVDVISDQGVPPGASVSEYLRQGIETADGVLLLLTPASEQSSWVSGEVALALAARSRDASKTIIPVLTSQHSQLPPLLFDVQALVWEPDRTNAKHAARDIAEALRKPNATSGDAAWDFLSMRQEALDEAQRLLAQQTVRQELSLRRTGAITGMIVALLAMLSGLVLALNDQSLESTLVSVTTIVMAASTVIAVRHGREH